MTSKSARCFKTIVLVLSIIFIVSPFTTLGTVLGQIKNFATFGDVYTNTSYYPTADQCQVVVLSIVSVIANALKEDCWNLLPIPHLGNYIIIFTSQ